MSTSYGTSHFISRTAAANYYEKSFGDGAYWRTAGQRVKSAMLKMVDDKIAAGEIHIGRPATKPGDIVSIIPGEGRYQITEGSAA